MCSFRLPVSSRRRQYARVLAMARDALARAFAEESETRGITKAGIADSLGRHKSFVTRKLTRAENMTLLTLSNLAHEMGRDVTILLPSHYVTGDRNHNGGAITSDKGRTFRTTFYGGQRVGETESDADTDGVLVE